MATPGASVGNNALITPGGAQGPVGAAGNPGSAGSPGSVGPTGPQGASVNYKGTVATSSALPATGNTADLWLASDTGHGWIWSGGAWKDSGPWQGPPGPSGTPGINAGATTTAQVFTVPPVGQTVQVNVSDASWIQPGQMLAIAQAGGPNLSGSLQVTAKTGNTLTLLNPVPSPAIPLADNTQPGLLTQVSNLTTDFVDGTNHTQDLATAVRPTIYSVRLRNWNSIGNCSFEVDQRNVGNAVVVAASTLVSDRWFVTKSGVHTATAQQVVQPTDIPGTSFRITNNNLKVTLTAQNASPGANDYLQIYQVIEGAASRELVDDTHSVSLLVSSSVANLNFSLVLMNSGGTQVLCKLCSLGAANVPTLIQLPNLPIFPSGQVVTPGNLGYYLLIGLMAGSSRIPSANNVWVSGGGNGAIGMSNFCASPVNSTFSVAMVQHEPGPLCTPLQDKPFFQNIEECQRYYAKSMLYSVAPLAGGPDTGLGCIVQAGNPYVACGTRFPKRMAKTPTSIAIINRGNTAQNSLQTVGAAAFTVSSVGLGSENGFGFFQSSTNFAVAWDWVIYHYTADTGW